ncbi:HAD family hydrolase [Singulisphaera sp. Ch08]|uniref:D,D-heptose 1,7-bisphosphate phosphatase n=1 Tax=Singulisphaera sp. Ch08 TaxID=3120278 RepID=A0AAU7CM57_9BACT
MTGEQAPKAQQNIPASQGAVRFERPTVPGGKPAVFLDRDGTIIEHVHYLSDVLKVRLLPGAAEAIGRLRAAGFACVVVTNQSAIGRGMITEGQLDLIHDEMNRQLAAAGTAVDAIEFCPETPGSDDRSLIEHIDRKPGPGMLFRATAALGLDLDASWMIGDMLSDILAGVNAGCRGSILVQTGKGLDEAEKETANAYHVTADLPAAADLILGFDAMSPSATSDNPAARPLSPS